LLDSLLQETVGVEESDGRLGERVRQRER